MHDLIWVIFKSKNKKILILQTSKMKNVYTLPEIDVNESIEFLSDYIYKKINALINIKPVDIKQISDDDPYGRRIEIFLCTKWFGDLSIKDENIKSYKWVPMQQLYDMQNQLTGYFKKLLDTIVFKLRHENG